MKWVVIIFIVSTINSFGQKNVSDYKYEINDSIKVIFSISEFDSSKHVVENCIFSNWVGVCLIDDKPIFGKDFSLPKFKIENANVIINGNTINLDVSCMYEKPIEKSIVLINCEGGYYLSLGFSDGAGTYMVQWRIIKEKSVRTIISNEEVVWQRQ